MRWRLDWRLDWRRDWRGTDEDRTVIPPYGPSGVATFVLDLENGFTITQRWADDVERWRSGKEHRIAATAAGKERYSGDVILIGDDVRMQRSRLARYAALGSTFLLALPHEALELTEAHAGTLVFVNDEEAQYADWLTEGQRVVVSDIDAEDRLVAIDAVVQSYLNGVVELNVDPGFRGAKGAMLMPTVPIVLEPQQNFARYPLNAERWQLAARAASVGFAPTLASVPILENGVDTGARAVARAYGEAGNLLSVERIDAGGYPDDGELVETGTNTRFNQKPGVTTLGDFATALHLSANFILRGNYDPDQALLFEQNELATGGTSLGRFGSGASLVTYNGDGIDRPVWNRRITIGATASDSIQALTDVVDYDAGLPSSLGKADVADGGRFVAFSSPLRSEQQWLRLFLWTVKGRQKAFWLPTWRADMQFVSRTLAGGLLATIKIRNDDGSDFFGWWPAQRQHIQVVETDGTITYTKVIEAVDNGDGTTTLGIGGEIASTNVEMISWLELCRFEKDDLERKYGSNGCRFETLARSVQQ